MSPPMAAPQGPSAIPALAPEAKPLKAYPPTLAYWNSIGL